MAGPAAAVAEAAGATAAVVVVVAAVVVVVMAVAVAVVVVVAARVFPTRFKWLEGRRSYQRLWRHYCLPTALLATMAIAKAMVVAMVVGRWQPFCPRLSLIQWVSRSGPRATRSCGGGLFRPSKTMA